MSRQRCPECKGVVQWAGTGPGGVTYGHCECAPPVYWRRHVKEWKKPGQRISPSEPGVKP